MHKPPISRIQATLAYFEISHAACPLCHLLVAEIRIMMSLWLYLYFLSMDLTRNLLSRTSLRVPFSGDLSQGKMSTHIHSKFSNTALLAMSLRGFNSRPTLTWTSRLISFKG
jgi:hypothetical protein